MGVFEHFPYTNFHDLNLDWIVQELEKLTVDVRDFISINAIKYADPIQWDITSQYEKNTVVLDKDGNAYLSVQPVPAGVSLDRTEYWTNIGNFSALWESVKNAITIPDEGHETTASAARQPNTLVWVDGKLLEVTSAMNAGDRYNTSEGGNSRLYTMQMLLDALLAETHDRENAVTMLKSDLESERNQRLASIEAVNGGLAQEITERKAADISINNKIDTSIFNIKLFGAVGDGVTDDTAAFNACMQKHNAVFFPYSEGGYKIGTVEIPNNAMIIGAGATIKQFTTLFDIVGSNVSFNGFTVEGDGKHTVFNFRNDLNNIEQVHISDIFTNNCGLVFADVEDGAYQEKVIYVQNVACRAQKKSCVKLSKAFAYLFFTRVTCDFVGTQTNAPGFSFKGTGGLVLSHCDVTGTGASAVYTDQTAFTFSDCVAVWIDGCMADTLSNRGFALTNCQWVYFNNAIVSLCSGIGLNGTNIENIFLEGCVFSSPAKGISRHIWIETGNSVRINDCKFYNCPDFDIAFTSVQNACVQNSFFKDGATSGIICGGTTNLFAFGCTTTNSSLINNMGATVEQHCNVINGVYEA